MKHYTLIAALAAGLIGIIATSSDSNAIDRRVTIINGTSYTMTAFHASNVSQDNWEEDMLDEDRLEPGQSFVANIDDNSGSCLYDFRAQFEGGREATKREVNVCKIETFTFND